MRSSWLEPVEERPGGLLYRCGGVEFALFESAGNSRGEFTQMGWQVEDLEAEVAELRRRGVVFEEYDLPGRGRFPNRELAATLARLWRWLPNRTRAFPPSWLSRSLSVPSSSARLSPERPRTPADQHERHRGHGGGVGGSQSSLEELAGSA